MQNDSWIKLYRKTLLNGILLDYPAWCLFTWMLLMCNRKGELRVSRFNTAQALDMNPNTFKDVLKRLEDKWEVITIKPTNRFSMVQIVNWTKYQNEIVNDTNKTPTGHQQNTTITRIENKNKDTHKTNDSHRSSKCPNPLGHSKCIEDITTTAEAFGKNWKLSMPKQIMAWHKMLSAGVSEKLMENAANHMDEDKFWSNKGWDLVDLSNVIAKGGKTYVSN